MITCLPLGGIGNQLFVVAACIGAAVKFNCEWTIPRSWDNAYYFRGPFNLEDIHLPKWKENCFEYKEITQSDVCLDGYFQSRRYFDHIKDEIKELFRPNHEIDDYINEQYGWLIEIPDTCAVHVRRQDYLQLSEYHYNLTIEYYNNAMEIVECSEIMDMVCFSDDIEWCKNNIAADYFIEDKDIVEFFLMCRMKNFIMANSTFSLMPAILSGSQNIIAPKNWFGVKKQHINTKDLYTKQMTIL